MDALRVLMRCYNELNYKDLADNTEKVFRENFPDESLEVEGRARAAGGNSGLSRLAR